HDERQNDSWSCFDKKYPLPTSQTEQPVHFEDNARHDICERIRYRHSEEQSRHDAAAISIGEPISEIEHNTGEKAGLGDTEQKAYRNEAFRPCDEGACGGQNPPGEHDTSDPTSSSHALKDQVARNLEDDIPKEEYAGPEAIHEGTEAQILVHGQCRHGNVGAVNVGDAICDQDKWHDSPRDLLDRSRFKWLRRVHKCSPERRICDRPPPVQDHGRLSQPAFLKRSLGSGWRTGLIAPAVHAWAPVVPRPTVRSP